jgi:hypothetical protein
MLYTLYENHADERGRGIEEMKGKKRKRKESNICFEV